MIFDFTLNIGAIALLAFAVADIIALYWYLPRFAASLGITLTDRVIQQLPATISGLIDKFLLKDKMTQLSNKGNEAKAERAWTMAQMGDEDPLKMMAVPFIEQIIDGSDAPKWMREKIKDVAVASLQKSGVNFTNWAVPAVTQWLDKKFPQLHASENLKALGVITNAEKIS